MIRYFVPCKTVSEANTSEHWAKRSARRKKQHKAAWLMTRNALIIWEFKKRNGLKIILTRNGARKMDSDNLAGSMKAIRDGIAEALEINDGNDEQAIWMYAQETVKKGAEVGVWVEMI